MIATSPIVINVVLKYVESLIETCTPTVNFLTIPSRLFH